MGNLKHYLFALKNGDLFFNDKRKFTLIINSVAVIHAIFGIFFLCQLVWPMVIYNAIIVLVYQGFLVMINNGKQRVAVALISTEVFTHAMLSILFIGLRCGFHAYLMGMMVVTCYATLSWKVYKGRKHSMVCYVFFNLLGFIACYLVGNFVPPVWTVSTMVAHVLYIFNWCTVFLLCLFFMVLLYWEVSFRNETLTDKNHELDQMAKMDHLTQLYNRRYMTGKFKEYLDALHENGELFSVIIGDIDFFKKVNDSYGHEAGDEVLVAVAGELKAALRDRDCVCRWGGEEFLILVKGDKEVAEMVGERIRARVEELSVQSGGHTIRVTMTLGGTEAVPGYSSDKLIQLADEALYQGKNEGRNRIVIK